MFVSHKLASIPRSSGVEAEGKSLWKQPALGNAWEVSTVPMEFVGIRDTYAESATPDRLMDKYGLTSPYIVQAVNAVLKRKRKA